MLSFHKVTLRRGAKLLFENGTFTLNAGEKMGVVGGNGAGKSSLLALLRGDILPESGDVEFPANWRIAHVAQEIVETDRLALEFAIDGDVELRQLEAELKKAEEADDGYEIGRIHGELLRIDAYSVEARAAELLTGLGFSEEAQYEPVSSFSGGWRMRLNLARALMCRSELLLLDEPTNHLDLETVMWLQDWLKSYQGTVLLISHDRNFLDAVVDRILEIRDQKLTLYTGTYSDYERQRAERLQQQQALYEKQQRQIAHIESFIERFRAKATKARQAQSRIKALARLERVAAAHVDSPFTFRFREPEAMSQTLIEAEKVAVGYGEKTVLKNINIRVTAGTRVGLLGRNGAGKSTLIKLIAGELEPQQGRLVRDKRIKFGYFAQHQLELLRPEMSALWHMQQVAPTTRDQDLRTFLGGFGFTDQKAFQATGEMSGGEKSRLVLATIVWQRPNLLLLDEPTNHLDLEVRAALTLALQDFEGAVVLVSHDTALMETVVDRYWLVDKGKVALFDGDLADYKAYRAKADREK